MRKRHFQFNCSLLAVLLVALALSGQARFHADFECGQTYLAQSVRPESRTLVLIPTPHLEEWPPESGNGIVEANLPEAAEQFTYQSREGTRLLGVEGIRNAHPMHASVQFGCFDRMKAPGKKKARITRRRPLGGTYSAFFPTSQKGGVELRYPFNPDTGSWCFGFHAKLTRALLAKPYLALPCFMVSRPGMSLPGVAFVRTHRDKTPHLRLYTWQTGVPAPKSISKREITGTAFYVEYWVKPAPDRSTDVNLLLNGELIASKRVPARGKGRALCRIGKLTSATAGDGFFVDEITLTKNPKVPLPRKPLVRVDGNRIVSSAFASPSALSKHVASHWQVHETNAWLMPLFNSGRDTIHLLNLPVPTEIHVLDPGASISIPTHIEPGREYLARARHQNAHGGWSDWSLPVRFDNRTAKQPHSMPTGVPGIRRVDFVEPGAEGSKAKLLKVDTWYNMRMMLEEPSFLGKLDHLEIILCGNPENRIGNVLNRGGAFSSQHNYSFVLSIPDRAAFLRERNGSAEFTPVKQRMRSWFNGEKGDFHVNEKRGEVSAAIRLLPGALKGVWEIRVTAGDPQGKRSLPFSRMIGVGAPLEEASFQEPGTALVWVIAAASLLLIVLVVTWSLKGRKAASKGKSETLALSPQTGKANKARIQRIQAYIREQHATQITVEDVARHVHVSPSHLGRLFSDAAGIPVNQYINQVRVEHAAKLLQESELSVADIAFRTGFNSPEYFAQVFRQFRKTSPAEYRANARS